MRTDEDLLDEVEHANNGEGPDPIVSLDDPAPARVAVAQMQVQAAERTLDRAVAAAREADHSWAQIGEVLGMTRQGANKRFSTI